MKDHEYAFYQRTGMTEGEFQFLLVLGIAFFIGLLWLLKSKIFLNIVLFGGILFCVCNCLFRGKKQTKKKVGRPPKTRKSID